MPKHCILLRVNILSVFAVPASGSGPPRKNSRKPVTVNAGQLTARASLQTARLDCTNPSDT
jgi:hypothetical protein